MSEKTRSRGGRSALSLGFLSVLSPSDVGFVGGYLILNGVGRPLEFHCTTPVKATRAQEILYGNSLKPYLFAEQIAPALVAKAKTPVALICVDRWELLDFADHASTPVAAVMLGDGGAPPAALHFSLANRRDTEEPLDPAKESVAHVGDVACFPDGASQVWEQGPGDAGFLRGGSSASPASAATLVAPAHTPIMPSDLSGNATQDRYTPNGLECRQGRFGRTRLVFAASHAPAVSRLLADWAPWTDALDLSEPFERIRAAIEEALRRG